MSVDDVVIDWCDLGALTDGHSLRQPDSWSNTNTNTNTNTSTGTNAGSQIDSTSSTTNAPNKL